MFKPVPRRKLLHGVVDQVMAAIASGEYAPGAQLPSERDLMRDFGVGRTAVREALQLLESRGILEIRHGARARVAGPARTATPLDQAIERLMTKSDSAIDDIKDARLVLETAIARRAAARASDQDISRLMAALEDNRRAIRSRDQYLATDIAFHRTIASISGNALFEAASETMLTWLARFRVDLVHVEGANLLSHDEHVRIAHAIAARDPDAAERAMSAHQLRSHALYHRLGATATSPRAEKPRTRSAKRGKQWSRQRSSRSPG